MSYFYKLCLRYNGSSYLGWQIQPVGRTVQGELNQALKIMAKTDDIFTMGSGRTDAGVHACAQIVKIEIPLKIDPESLKRALNVHLPNDIRVVNAEVCASDFHPIFHAKVKHYSYFFRKAPYPDPFLGNFIGFTKFHLNFELMNQGLQLLVGTHDFKAFQVEGTEVKSTVRTIFEATIKQSSPPFLPFVGDEDIYEISFQGNGFLKQMVRMMVGAVWNLGRGKIELSDLNKALTSQAELHSFKRLAPVAPPQGLYLMKVDY